MRLGKWLYTIPLGLHSLVGREQVEKDHAPPYCVLDKVLQVTRHPAARPWKGYNWMARAAASICSARGLTRMSSVKFSQRTVPERSTKNWARRKTVGQDRQAGWCCRAK